MYYISNPVFAVEKVRQMSYNFITFPILSSQPRSSDNCNTILLSLHSVFISTCNTVYMCNPLLCTDHSLLTIYLRKHNKKRYSLYRSLKMQSILFSTKNKQEKQTPWSESASELYRPGDRRLSANDCQLLRIKGATWSA
jgi:hypothetical protein